MIILNISDGNDMPTLRIGDTMLLNGGECLFTAVNKDSITGAFVVLTFEPINNSDIGRGNGNSVHVLIKEPHGIPSEG